MSTSTPWVVCHTPRETGLRLFCFPFAGGGSIVFRPWSRLLPSSVEVCAVQPPGRENRLREPLLTSVDAVVAALVPELAPLLEERGFAFFGHSMGALLAFETARELRRRGFPGPAHLLVSGSRAPHAPLPAQPLHGLSEPELVDHLRRFNGTPQRVLDDLDLLRLFLPLVRADLSVSERYACAQTGEIQAPISAFAGTRDAHASAEQMAAWGAQTTAGFTLTPIEGDHFFLQGAQADFLAALQAELASNGLL